MIHEREERDFHRIKNHGRIPPVEAMLSPEQRWALYSGAEIPKDQKVLGYRYQVLMIIIAPSKNFSESPKRMMRVTKLRKTIKRSSLPRYLQRSRKEVKQCKMNF